MPRSTGGVRALDLFIGTDRMTAHAPRPAERRRASALEAAGLTPQRAVYWNLGPPELYEHAVRRAEGVIAEGGARSEEHTSELQSRLHLVCRLLLEKKKRKMMVIISV